MLVYVDLYHEKEEYEHFEHTLLPRMIRDSCDAQVPACVVGSNLPSNCDARVGYVPPPESSVAVSRTHVLAPSY